MIGIIGIGAMGMGMARNLQARGAAVRVRDIMADACAQAAAAGMTVCDSPGALASEAGLIILVVVNAAQVDAVLFGADGVVSGTPAGSGKTVMICSTIAPEDTVRIAQRLADHGIDLIDAPISGGPVRAADGSMSMMLAGAAAVLAAWEPVLDALAAKQFRISERIGDGARAKLVNNLLAGINLVAGAEALGLAIRLGLAPHQIFELICASSGQSWIMADRMARALQDDYAPRAAAHILTKDMTLATAMAAAAHYPTPLGDAALARYRQTLARGWSAQDDAAVLKTYLTPDPSA
ncbi:MAG: NAD(P)-dependent oxidoreductase [Herminiimonas sp.]|nr:NAD(P)-dependent oxidoreductase [Herminiimonas sp.]